MSIQLLPWDSEILGLSVAKILPGRMDYHSLNDILLHFKSQGIRLVYWASDSTDLASQAAAEAHRGLLVDHKVTYLIKLPVPASISVEIQPYSNTYPSPELEELALQSGLYSRFRTDPNISTDQFETIYRHWIANSTQKQIAQEVFVIYREEKLAGFITLGEKQTRGDIGLLAVSETWRGLNLGRMLVDAALSYFSEQGYSYSQVVTQSDNIPACRLYERCGYQVEKIEHFYHFWL